MIWTKTQVAAHQRALAVARQWEETIRHLQELAKVTPALADRVQELSDARDHLELSTMTAIAIDGVGR